MEVRGENKLLNCSRKYLGKRTNYSVLKYLHQIKVKIQITKQVTLNWLKISIFVYHYHLKYQLYGLGKCNICFKNIENVILHIYRNCHNFVLDKKHMLLDNGPQDISNTSLLFIDFRIIKYVLYCLLCDTNY